MPIFITVIGDIILRITIATLSIVLSGKAFKILGLRRGPIIFSSLTKMRESWTRAMEMCHALVEHRVSATQSSVMKEGDLL